MKKLNAIIVKSLCTILLIGAIISPFASFNDTFSNIVTIASKDKVGGGIV